MMPHQPLDPASADAAALCPQDRMNTRAAITPAAVAMHTNDFGYQKAIDRNPAALRPRAPSVIAGRRDTKDRAHLAHRVIVAAIFDEAESHVRVPAKIAIDFFKMSRSIRSRSFSRLSWAISEAWSAVGSAACVAGRRAAAAGCPKTPNLLIHLRNTVSANPISAATEPIERPLDRTSSTVCRL
jgi:hypothetical protein